MIRFLKPANEDDDEGDARRRRGTTRMARPRPSWARRVQNRKQRGRGKADVQMQQMMGGGGFVQQDAGNWARGKVVTTSGKEVVGQDPHPLEVSCSELEFGTLTLVPDKLRSITFTEIDKKKTATAGKPGARPRPARTRTRRSRSPPSGARTSWRWP